MGQMQHPKGVLIHTSQNDDIDLLELQVFRKQPQDLYCQRPYLIREAPCSYDPGDQKECGRSYQAREKSLACQ